MEANYAKKRRFPALQLLAVLFVLAAAAAANAGTDGSVADSAFVSISLMNQQPEPVSPGERLELKFKIENLGSKPANDVVVELVPKYPFVVDEAEKAKQIGSLFGRQKGKDAVLVRFFVAVDSSAASGIFNTLALRYKTASQDWTTTSDFNISVGQRELPLAITSVQPEPETFVQGEKSSLKLGISNFGGGEALNVKVRLNASDSSPFLAYGSANEAVIPAIKPKGSATAAFLLITSPDAKSGLYRMGASLAYSDSQGRNYTSGMGTFGIAVGPEAKLAAAVLESEPLKLGTKRKITLEVINRGLTDVKFLTAAIARSESYEIVSANSAYIGELDSGDSETVTYEVFFHRQALPVLELSYIDALNRPGRQSIEVPVRIYTGSELMKFGLEKGNGKGLLLTAAIIILGLLAYRKIRKKK